MNINKKDNLKIHKKIALGASLFILLLFAVTGAGLMVFSPTAGAWPTSTFAFWNPPADKAISDQETKNSLPPGQGAETEDSEEKWSFLGSLLNDEKTEIDKDEITEAITAEVSERMREAGEEAIDKTITQAKETVVSELTGSDPNGQDSNDRPKVTEQDIEQAAALGKETIGFWGMLWNVVSGLVATAVGLVTG
jgi:hypothetical protein